MQAHALQLRLNRGEHVGEAAPIDVLDGVAVKTRAVQHGDDVAVQIATEGEGPPERVQPVQQPGEAPYRPRLWVLAYISAIIRLAVFS